MLENKKFTTEELDELKGIRSDYDIKIGEFGQLELEILLTSQRIETLAKAKEALQTQYVELQTKEQEAVKKLNDKYGAGSVDIESGEFIPSAKQ